LEEIEDPLHQDLNYRRGKKKKKEEKGTKALGQQR